MKDVQADLTGNKAHLSERKTNRSLIGSMRACFSKIRSAWIMLASPHSTWKGTHLVNTGILLNKASSWYLVEQHSLNVSANKKV